MNTLDPEFRDWLFAVHDGMPADEEDNYPLADSVTTALEYVEEFVALVPALGRQIAPSTLPVPLARRR